MWQAVVLIQTVDITLPWTSWQLDINTTTTAPPYTVQNFHRQGDRHHIWHSLGKKPTPWRWMWVNISVQLYSFQVISGVEARISSLHAPTEDLQESKNQHPTFFWVKAQNFFFQRFVQQKNQSLIYKWIGSAAWTKKLSPFNHPQRSSSTICFYLVLLHALANPFSSCHF